eukprot:TRINITY_DN14716_c0_g1_i1.p1 TRINITY_DN14716_c0_g1~~TRINITY_DN14716_c0_g1_i1.p1  ORF type:complete len:379 (-),score=98.82 TRINITY_DN14716_c0_g1_i1:177-1223(-)
MASHGSSECNPNSDSTALGSDTSSDSGSCEGEQPVVERAQQSGVIRHPLAAEFAEFRLRLALLEGQRSDLLKGLVCEEVQRQLSTEVQKVLDPPRENLEAVKEVVEEVGQQCRMLKPQLQDFVRSQIDSMRRELIDVRSTVSRAVGLMMQQGKALREEFEEEMEKQRGEQPSSREAKDGDEAGQQCKTLPPQLEHIMHSELDGLRSEIHSSVSRAVGLMMEQGKALREEFEEEFEKQRGEKTVSQDLNDKLNAAVAQMDSLCSEINGLVEKNPQKERSATPRPSPLLRSPAAGSIPSPMVSNMHHRISWASAADVRPWAAQPPPAPASLPVLLGTSQNTKVTEQVKLA